MPFFRTPDRAIRYEIGGAGEPLLLLPAGGMDATIEFWERTAFNPFECLGDVFRVIALDSRNAGQSVGPIDAADPWGMYLSDHLDLLNHLGIERAHVLGCCIGASHALRMAVSAPGRVGALVLEQPIGITPRNRRTWLSDFDLWARQLRARRPSIDAVSLEEMGRRMWSGDFVLSVDRGGIEASDVPMLILPGIDDMHPPEIGSEIARLARRGEICQPWKMPPRLVPGAVARIRAFLRAHAIDPR